MSVPIRTVAVWIEKVNDRYVYALLVVCECFFFGVSIKFDYTALFIVQEPFSFLSLSLSIIARLAQFSFLSRLVSFGLYWSWPLPFFRRCHRVWECNYSVKLPSESGSRQSERKGTDKKNANRIKTMEN